jgi:hypothetical protein
MGAIRHRQLMRRQFGLVSQQPAQGFSLEDRRWLQTQGIDRPDQLPRKSLWYRPDGSSHMGHSDPYHLARYRQRGMTLKPPVFNVQEHQPTRVPMPSIARQVLYLLGQEERWEGSASDLAAIIGSRTPTGISRALGTTKVAVALAAAGVTVERGYRGSGRVLRLERRSAA